MQNKPDDIQWFLDLLAISKEVEEQDPSPLLEWLELKRQNPSFSAKL
ncbi:uncharacterized protein METZ01_LOCUS469351, partial [marine metagenome]